MISMRISPLSPRHRGTDLGVRLLLFGLRSLKHGRLLLLLELLLALLPGRRLLLLDLLLRLLLGRQALLLLLGSAFHAPLSIGLVEHELAVHALHGHFPWAPGLLDAIPVILVDLVVSGVILGLRHWATERS